ncbi:MAG: riboflavin kinase / adenylyltransferase [Solirubrobacteraceae bacterium]|jgi:riboflavin kinase/FMN adenylyltransferase|nr:riboflavin kinase / adenylyltransferase [Solirubrobacteraceae bacterium]
MKVTYLPDVEPRSRRVAVGVFDGVHLGHREVIGGSDTVLTFEPHPLSVIQPAAAPKLLTPLDVKAELVEELGVEEMVVIPFDDAFAQRSAEDFVSGVLVDALQATRVSVGRNFRFGHKARGDAALLAENERFEARVCGLVEVEGETVSSSHIRGLLAAGEVEHAIAFLGQPFQLRGEVVHGDGRGRELGFPTANLVPDERLVRPDMGVYACRANGVPAAINIGVRPLFETGRGVLIEAHLIDHDEDLYGTELRIDFLSRLRGERMFDSVEALVEEIARDVERTRELAG